MAREIGLNPKKLGKIDNSNQEPWKLPLPLFIEKIYTKNFRKPPIETAEPIEKIYREQKRRKNRKKAGDHEKKAARKALRIRLAQELIVRRAVPTDAVGISTFLGTQPENIGLRTADTWLVAIFENDIVGLLSMTKYLNMNLLSDSAIITFVKVQEAMSRHGIGKRLVAAAVGEANRCGCDQIETVGATSKENIKMFFKDSGFSILHEFTFKRQPGGVTSHSPLNQ
jgi:N-acetylglutamate synthase-like GNAT family acetyltransferase